MIRPLVAVIVLGLLAGCRGSEGPAAPPAPALPDLSLLALGDSYTVGQSLPAQWSWPYQLADSLSAGGDTLNRLQLIACTGWTTRDLLDAVRDSQTAGVLADHYGLVTLMIGVNNQFQGLDPAVTAAELDTLITLARKLAGGDPQRVLGFSIPDYGVTPVGTLFDSDRICREIAEHNTLLAEQLAAQNVDLINISDLSLLAAEDPSLVARDGLHYSREMYRRWVSRMLPAVKARLLPANPGE